MSKSRNSTPTATPERAPWSSNLTLGGFWLKKAEGISEKGKECMERSVRFIPDGKPHPSPDINGLKYAATKTDPNTMTREVTREDGSVVGGSTTVVSADGKTKTVTNFGYDTQLRQFKLRPV